MILPPSPLQPTYVLGFPKLRSSNENVNENKNFRSFSRTFSLKFFAKIAKFIRNFHDIRENSLKFSAKRSQ